MARLKSNNLTLTLLFLFLPSVNASVPCSTSDTCPGVNYSLEQSVVDVIVGATAFATCFCNTINEVLPITGNNVTYTCRPDVCCAVTKYGDLNAGVALIMIRAFKSLTIGNLPLTPGGSPFPYFTTGPFLDDIDSLFEIAFGLTLCIGNMVRSVFQVANLGKRLDHPADTCPRGSSRKTVLNSLSHFSQVLSTFIVLCKTHQPPCCWQ